MKQDISDRAVRYWARGVCHSLEQAPEATRLELRAHYEADRKYAELQELEPITFGEWLFVYRALQDREAELG